MTMDHAEALERIEIAAAEPDGLERLIAGDTSDAAAVAGHLTGCAECTRALDQLHVVSIATRDVVRSAPDPALRERTLALVRAVGRERGEAIGVRTGASAATVALAPPNRPADRFSPARGRLRALPRAPLAALAAAAVVVAALAGFGARGLVPSAGTPGQGGEVRLLQEATTAALRVEAEPDVRRVALAIAPGASSSGGSIAPDASGTLVFSPASGELVVVATGLGRPPAGREYGCWVEANGVRTRIGRMYFGGDLATWTGRLPGLAALAPGTVFGVSLGPPGGGTEAVPVMSGSV